MIATDEPISVDGRVLALLPAYNPDPADFKRSLDSLLNQTHPIDICVIDDGSKLPVSTICQSHPQVTLLRLEQNGGITKALRAGVEYGLKRRYEYFCRLDVGDASYPQRVAMQLAYMVEHPEIDLLGSYALVTDPERTSVRYLGATGGPQALRRRMWRNSAFLHPTFFIRTASVRKFGSYDVNFNGSEDNEFMQRFAKYGKVDCLPDVLVEVVDSPTGISATRRSLQLRQRLRVQLKYAAPLSPGWYLGVARTVTLLALPPKLSKMLRTLARTRLGVKGAGDRRSIRRDG